jgi:hypothetical protein
MLRIHSVIRLMTIIGAITASAAAADFNYPATLCVLHEGTMKRHINTASNPSDDNPATFLCPGVKAPSSGANLSGGIRVKDQSSTQDVTCKLTLARQSGDDIFWATDTKKTTGFDSQWQTLSFGEISLQVSYSSPYISCSIPEKTSNGESAVGTYRIRDFD